MVKRKVFFEDEVEPDYEGQLVWYGGELMTWEEAQAYEAAHLCSKSVMDFHDSLEVDEREAEYGNDEFNDDEDLDYDNDEEK